MISFFKEEVTFELNSKLAVKAWIKAICKENNKVTGEINYVFCNDEYLLEINKQYLKHDYYTDIITFDQSDTDETVEGEIYISIDRVKENSITNKQSYEEELLRVMIHGIFHLIGFGDKTEAESQKMRLLETEAILKLAVPRGAVSKTKA